MKLPSLQNIDYAYDLKRLKTFNFEKVSLVSVSIPRLDTRF